jgi:alpha-L-rhamnosidase
MGATTIWERWDAMLPDGSINPGSMTSFNHYAFGAVADFLHRVVAGLAPAEPGYRSIVVKPVPGRPLTSAGAIHATPYGLVKVAWRRESGRFLLDLDVPKTTTASVFLPQRREPETVGPGRHTWDVEDPVRQEASLSRLATVLDLLGHEAAWLEFSKVLGTAAEALDGRPMLDVLKRLADTPVLDAIGRPLGPGMPPLPDETRDQLRTILARYST